MGGLQRRNGFRAFPARRAEENAVKKRARCPNSPVNRREKQARRGEAASGNREIVDAKVLAGDRNFANGLLMRRRDLRGTAVAVLMDKSCNFCAKLDKTAAAKSKRFYNEARGKNRIDVQRVSENTEGSISLPSSLPS